MPEAVYLLCAITSGAAGVLLARGWQRRRTPLLLWSSICFACLVVNNVLLFADLVLVPSLDLSVLRGATQLAGGLTLLYGLIWDVR